MSSTTVHNVLDSPSHTVAVSVECVHIQLHWLRVFPLSAPLINAQLSVLVKGFIILLNHVPSGSIVLQKSNSMDLQHCPLLLESYKK